MTIKLPLAGPVIFKIPSLPTTNLKLVAVTSGSSDLLTIKEALVELATLAASPA